MLPLFGELLVELGLHAMAAPFRREPNVWLAVLGYLLLGAMVGALSLWAFPAHLTRDGWPRGCKPEPQKIPSLRFPRHER